MDELLFVHVNIRTSHKQNIDTMWEHVEIMKEKSVFLVVEPLRKKKKKFYDISKKLPEPHETLEK